MEEYLPIIDIVLQEVYELSQDQYGNYLIQHIIEHQNQKEIRSILNQLKGKIFELSIHKYASNVIEKLLTYGSLNIKQIIIEEIISMDDKIQYLLFTQGFTIIISKR